MAVRFLDARQVAGLLPELFDKHDEIRMAVAWSSNGAVADCLFSNKQKFRQVIFGVAFCQSDPDLIDRLVGVKNAFVPESSNQHVFHPKLYYFRSGEWAEAIIGSSNFTAGGLIRNQEANLHIRGKDISTVFHEIRQALDSYAPLTRPVTQDMARAYRLQAEAACAARAPRHPVLPFGG